MPLRSVTNRTVIKVGKNRGVKVSERKELSTHPTIMFPSMNGVSPLVYVFCLRFTAHVRVKICGLR